MPVRTGPCDPWPVRLCCDVEAYDEANVEHWRRVASQILWALSGRRIGLCPVRVRPCRRACLETAAVSFQAAMGTGPWVPYIDGAGVWRNASVCGCRSGCSCGELCEVYLPGLVYDVVSVDVGGQVLAPEQYRVDSPGRLVRVGGGCWPSCQDLAEPPGAPGTFTVTYRVGIPVDEAATAAVSALVCHLLKGCGTGGACGCKAGPRNVSRLVRQGVEFDMSDAALLYAEGRTGIPEVDLWLQAVNPYRLTSPSRAYSPDVRPPRVTTWP